MAALPFTVDTGELALTAATPLTAITLGSPSNQRVRVKGVTVCGKGTTSTDTPIKIELRTYASISGGTAGSVTTSKNDGDEGETVQSTPAGNYSAEPTYTTGVTFKTLEVHPQGNIYIPLEERILKGGTGFAVRLTAAQNQTVTVSVDCEE